MKTIQVKLVPDKAQEESILRTVRTFRDACNWISEKAFETKTFNQIALHRITYKECREKFNGFSSQLVVRAIAAVADAYKLDRRRQRSFWRDTAVYDCRVLSWKGDRASIWTVDGRMDIPMRVWDDDLFGKPKGESDLVRRDGKWYLMVSVNAPDEPAYEPKGWLGVDLGIANLAVSSDGTFFSGKKVETVRQRYFRHRRRLQARNTKSARRRIRKTGNREARFRKDVNHVISKNLVSKAKGTFSGLALEDLKGIGRRTTVGRSQRARHMGWAFAQMRSFIEYKARGGGVPVRIVNARGTSRTCSECGHEDKRNRKSQSEFLCRSCGFSEHADLNASINISHRAAVNQPIVPDLGHKPTASAVGR